MLDARLNNRNGSFSIIKWLRVEGVKPRKAAPRGLILVLWIFFGLGGGDGSATVVR